MTPSYTYAVVKLAEPVDHRGALVVLDTLLMLRNVARVVLVDDAWQDGVEDVAGVADNAIGLTEGPRR